MSEEPMNEKAFLLINGESWAFLTMCQRCQARRADHPLLQTVCRIQALMRRSRPSKPGLEITVMT
jgi:hypothetical protein